MENNQHHEYDGIIEHNNPMPTWWTWSFIFTVMFAFIYYLHYEISGDGLSLQEELTQSMAQLEMIKSAAAKNVPLLSEADLDLRFKDPEIVKMGASIYQAKCAMCHGPELEGKIGPNLTDNVWLNGQGTLTEIAGLIRNGVPIKGMPPWQDILTADEIYSLVGLIKQKHANE